MKRKYMKSNENFCEIFLKHKPENSIGDNHVFVFRGLLMCDMNGYYDEKRNKNYDCSYGNNNCRRVLIGGNIRTGIGICLSNGLKSVSEKSELVEEVEASSV